MCYKGKCLYCIPVENGCLVFAILSAISTLTVLLACFAVGLLTLAGLIFATHEVQNNPEFDLPWNQNQRNAVTQVAAIGGVAVSVATLIACIPSLIAFIFSVLLCNGICKRRPGQVKAYFIYGVVITVLAVVASIIQMMVSYDSQLGIIGLSGCVIYALVLWMVHETYIKLSSGVVYKDHIRLVEN